MKIFIISVLVFICLKVNAQDNTFYFVSAGQLFVPAKSLDNKNVDPKSLIHGNDHVIITIDMDLHTAYIDYLNSIEKNTTLKLAKNPQKSNENDSFDFKIIEDDKYKVLHYIGGEKKLISLETINKDQQIFGDLKDTDVEDNLVIFIKKTDLIFSSTSRMEYTSTELAVAYKAKNIDKLNVNNRIIEDAIIEIDRIKKAIIVTSKKYPSKNKLMHYQKAFFGIKDNFKIFGFDGIDDPAIGKVILSMSSGAFSIELKNGIFVIYNVASL